MNGHKNFFTISLTVTFIILLYSSTALAVFKTGGAPSSKAGEPPYGLTAQENASGAKLNGVLQISFTNLGCNEAWEDASGDCDLFGPNAADSKVSLRLSTTNNDQTVLFYVDLDQVRIYSITRIQQTVMEALRNEILNAFFEADCDEAVPVNCSQEIYLKTFTNYSEATISTAPDGDPYSEFSAIADLTLAVD
ncbi:MAG: hypothetical protein RQ754_12080 [Desulfuromonadales bacterium]|nr:hypothetical protein [Desulfuromonadales bacterium]